jgi:hypothetical protein
MAPGGLLLGDPGQRCRCGHAHGRGDRCLSCQLTPAFREQVVAGVKGPHRTAFAAARLRRTDDTIAAMALEAGSNRISAFNHRSRRLTGMTPRARRKRARA